MGSQRVGYNWATFTFLTWYPMNIIVYSFSISSSNLPSLDWYPWKTYALFHGNFNSIIFYLDSSLGFTKGSFRFYFFKHLWPSVQFSHSFVSDSLRPHGLQHARAPYPSSTPGVYSNSCLLSRWGHPTISSSVVPFSSCLQSFLASGSFPMSQFFISDGQSIGVSASASFLPMNIQDWFPLGWTDWISLQSKGFSRVFSNTTVQKHQFFSTQLSL